MHDPLQSFFFEKHCTWVEEKKKDCKESCIDNIADIFDQIDQKSLTFAHFLLLEILDVTKCRPVCKEANLKPVFIFALKPL